MRKHKKPTISKYRAKQLRKQQDSALGHALSMAFQQRPDWRPTGEKKPAG